MIKSSKMVFMKEKKCIVHLNNINKELNIHGSIEFPLEIYHDDLLKEEVPWHWHEDLEFIVVTTNKLFIKVGAQQFVLKKGEGLFINQGVLHEVTNVNNEEGRLKAIVFHPRLIGGNVDSIYYKTYLSTVLKSTEIPYLILKHDILWQSDILNKILEGYNLCLDAKDGYEFEIRYILSKIIFSLYQNMINKNIELSEKEIRNTNRLKLMINYINEHLSENLDLYSIASIANISESEALRCFKTTINETPMQYVINLRLQRAAELLISNSNKVIDIAFDCGFSEPSYFSKKFREKYDVTPKQYRERERII